MKDVLTELHAKLVVKTGSGEALESVAGRIYSRLADKPIDQRFSAPAVLLAPGQTRTLDVCQGARHVVRQGVVELICVVSFDQQASDAHEAAHAAADSLQASVERVLAGLRGVTNATHPEGVWHHLAWEQKYATTGELAGTRFWLNALDLTVRFRRTRAVA